MHAGYGTELVERDLRKTLLGIIPRLDAFTPLVLAPRLPGNPADNLCVRLIIQLNTTARVFSGQKGASHAQRVLLRSHLPCTYCPHLQ